MSLGGGGESVLLLSCKQAKLGHLGVDLEDHRSCARKKKTPVLVKSSVLDHISLKDNIPSLSELLHSGSSFMKAMLCSLLDFMTCFFYFKIFK